MSANVEDAADLTPEHGIELYRQMLRVRRFEEHCAELYTSSKIRGFLHLYIGEEAVAVGTAQVLRPEDAVVATYREHGQALVRGISARALMAELFGKREGCCRGRGGSMHFFDAATQFYGGQAIVGAGLPLAVGLALAFRQQGIDAIAACYFGDGAVAEGEFHESMNLASLWRLPVLFLCENNLYAMGTGIERAQAEPNLHLKASGYRIPAESVDGMEVLAVESAARRAAHQVQKTRSPYFLELRTYRFRAHSMFDPELYRSKEEVNAWKLRDPLVTFPDHLRRACLADDAALAAVAAEVERELDDAIAFAERGTLEPVESLLDDVYTPDRPEAR